MNRLAIAFLMIPMFLNVTSSAQKKEHNFMQWKIAATLPAISRQSISLGFAGPVAGVHNGVLIVAGGSNFPDSMPWLGGKKVYYGDAYALKEDKKGKLHYFQSFQLPYPIAYAACCSTPQGIICAGGENEKGISGKVLLLQWNAEKLTIKNLPGLPLPLTNAAITSNGHMVYIAGGETTDSVSNHLYSLDLEHIKKGWKQLPHIPEPVSHTVIAIQSDGHHSYLYLIGGRKKNVSGISSLYASVYRYDVEKGQWQQKQSLPYALSAGTGLTIGKNHILLFGGDKGGAFHQTEELIAAINREKDNAKKLQFIQQKNKLQATHPGFSKEVWQYNTITDEWKVIDTIPFDVPVTTTAVKWGKCVFIPNGEIKAGVRTPQILEGKMRDE